MYPSAGNPWVPPPSDEDTRAAPPPPLAGPSEPSQISSPLQHVHPLPYPHYPGNPAAYAHAPYYPTPYAELPVPPPYPPPHLFDAGTQPCLPVPPPAPPPQLRISGTPSYSVAHYTHDRTFAAVESARWTGAAEVMHQSPTLAGALPLSATGLSDDDGRRWSGASSGGESGDSPRVGTVGLPLEDDLALPPPEIKPFVQKLFSMLSDPDHYQDVILWNHAGDAFFVAHNDRFIKEVLPSAFGHSNVHSFTRQLNVYNFQRMNVAQLRLALDLQGGIAGAYSGWSHTHFRRGDPSTLALLAPRPSRARLIRKLEKQYGGSSASASTSSGASSAASSTGLRSPLSNTSMRLPNPPPLLPTPSPQAPIYHLQSAPEPPPPS